MDKAIAVDQHHRKTYCSIVGQRPHHVHFGMSCAILRQMVLFRNLSLERHLSIAGDLRCPSAVLDSYMTCAARYHFFCLDVMSSACMFILTQMLACALRVNFLDCSGHCLHIFCRVSLCHEIYCYRFVLVCRTQKQHMIVNMSL